MILFWNKYNAVHGYKCKYNPLRLYDNDLFNFLHQNACFIVSNPEIVFLVFSDLCLGCGDTKISIPHPLFEGGLCEECKVSISILAFKNYFIVCRL